MNEIDYAAQAVHVALCGLARLAPGRCRLRRVEASRRAPVADWLRAQFEEGGALAAAGRWFVLDADLLPFYAADAAGAAPQLRYVDVEREALENWRVARVRETIAGRTPASFSRDPENDFFVPRAVAERSVRGPMLVLS